MRYWVGSVLFLSAAAFLWSGLRHRRRVIAIAPRDAIMAQRAIASEDPRSLAALSEIGRPIVLFFVAWIGVKSGLAYVWLDAGRWLSPFDLAGLYALLVAYGVSFTIESKYRMSDAVAAAAALPSYSTASTGSSRAASFGRRSSSYSPQCASSG